MVLLNPHLAEAHGSRGIALSQLGRHHEALVAYDRSLGRQTSAMSFIVNRPEHEPGFRLERQESHDRVIRYTIHSYAGLNTPAGERYGGEKHSELAPSISQSKAKPNGSKAEDD